MGTRRFFEQSLNVEGNFKCLLMKFHLREYTPWFITPEKDLPQGKGPNSNLTMTSDFDEISPTSYESTPWTPNPISKIICDEVLLTLS